MTAITVELTVDLKNEKFPNSNGPIFYRWIPSSEHDAIFLVQNDISLKVWFDEKSYVYKSNKEKNNDHTGSNDTPVYAGPLKGKLICNRPEILPILAKDTSNLPREEMKRLTEFVTEIVTKILYPNVSNFINILRFVCGQFWIKEMDIWDSSRLTLAGYCKEIKLRWSSDGYKWWEFKGVGNTPTYLNVSYNLSSQYEEFLNEKDWNGLRKIIDGGYEPALSAELASEAHMLEDKEDVKNSYIKGVTALEQSLLEYSKTKRTKLPSKASNSKKLFLLSKTIGMPDEDLNHSIRAIKIRNEIVHEGLLSEDDHYTILRGLFKLISLIHLSSIGFKSKCPPLQRRFTSKLRLM